MLKEMFEQFINSQMVYRLNITRIAHYYEYYYSAPHEHVEMTVIVNTCFQYGFADMEKLVNKGVLHIIKLTFC